MTLKKQKNGKTAPAKKSPSRVPEKNKGDYRNDILEKVLFLKQQLKHYPLKEFRFSPEKFERYYDGICFAAHEPGIVASMVSDILRHFGMPPENIHIKIQYIAEDATYNEIGTYSKNDTIRGTVTLRIKPSYTYDTIIYIAAHECTHHYLSGRNVRLEDTQENERLTDVAVIYLGCGFYYSFGSPLESKFSRETQWNGQTVIQTTTYRLGYLKENEFDFAYEQIKGIRESRIKQVNESKMQYREKTAELFKEYEVLDRRNQELIDANRDIRIICENDRISKLSNIFFKSNSHDAHQLKESFKSKMNQGLSLSEIKTLYEAVKKQTELRKQENEFLVQCRNIADFQALLDNRVREYIDGIIALSVNGNVFAMYEKIKFYASIPDSGDDARALFDAIEKIGGADALLILGRCCREGIGTERNVNMAKYYFYNSWMNGSEAAKKEMDALEATAAP